jgi:serine/threonine protein kinase
MVAGKVPFKGPTSSHTIVAIIERDPEPIEHASPELRQLISTALQKDRALRFQTAAAMASAIDEVKHRLGYISDQNVSHSVPTARMISTPAAGRDARRPSRKMLWLVPGAVALLLIGSVAVFAIAGWLLELGRVSDDPGNANSLIPTPTLTPAAPSPTPTSPMIYVAPTPVTTVTPEPVVTPVRSTPRPVVERPTPQPRRTPRPKPRPSRDPNCVFTNTC